MALPTDSHVHSEWSWDAPQGSMERTCERAMAMGLPAVAFTEHVDITTWTIMPGELDVPEQFEPYLAPDGASLTPPPLDVDGYLASIERCRGRFSHLRILSGVELGEPHWHEAVVAKLLSASDFDRVLGSLHCLPVGDEQYAEPPGLFRRRVAADVVRDYLAELPRLIQASDAFAALAHIDYPTRHWPAAAGPFDPYAFEDEFRHALRVLADGSRALEVNTRNAPYPTIVRWWRDEGGEAVTFGSDAHDPAALAQSFGEAAAMVEAIGFRPGRHPWDFWVRTGRRFAGVSCATRPWSGGSQPAGQTEVRDRRDASQSWPD
jgi:histidinol-phosphatase (PHP family)